MIRGLHPLSLAPRPLPPLKVPRARASLPDANLGP